MRPTTRTLIVGLTIGAYLGIALADPGDLWRWAAFGCAWLVLRRDWRDARDAEATTCPFHPTTHPPR